VSNFGKKLDEPTSPKVLTCFQSVSAEESGAQEEISVSAMSNIKHEFNERIL